MDHIVCDTVLEAARVALAIHRLSGILGGRSFPYTTPLRPEDRVGPDDGSTVIVRRHVRPILLADGKIAVPVTPFVASLLGSGRLAEVSELTAIQRTRIANLFSARRALLDAEIAADQASAEEL